MDCTLGNNQKMLQGPCVTGTQEERNSSTKKMSETQARKNVWQSTQHN